MVLVRKYLAGFLDSCEGPGQGPLLDFLKVEFVDVRADGMPHVPGRIAEGTPVLVDHVLPATAIGSGAVLSGRDGRALGL